MDGEGQQVKKRCPFLFFKLPPRDVVGDEYEGEERDQCEEKCQFPEQREIETYPVAILEKDIRARFEQGQRLELPVSDLVLLGLPRPVLHVGGLQLVDGVEALDLGLDLDL